jgi:hypothetical protein
MSFPTRERQIFLMGCEMSRWPDIERIADGGRQTTHDRADMIGDDRRGMELERFGRLTIGNQQLKTRGERSYVTASRSRPASFRCCERRTVDFYIRTPRPMRSRVTAT